ncbi:hypothetical protein MRX96_045612 [Rhipicephalus microplus]
MVRGGDGMQQPPPGLLSQLLRPPAPAGKGLAMAPQQQQSNQDMLVKILAGMGPVSPGLQPPPMASHQPLSPTAQLLAARHDPMAGGSLCLCLGSALAVCEVYSFPFGAVFGFVSWNVYKQCCFVDANFLRDV